MKKLGIIGGMGPFADDTFLSLLHKYTVSDGDRGHISFILDGMCNRPDRSAFLSGNSPKSPLPSLISSARMLEKCGCDIIAMPCNTAHAWIKSIESSIKRARLLNMPALTAEVLRKRGVKSATVFCTEGARRARVFDTALQAKEIVCRYPVDSVFKKCGKIISDTKRGNNTSNDLKHLIESCGNGVYITGCTELSASLVLLNKPLGSESLTVIDTLSVLVREIITISGRKSKHILYT